MKNARLFLVIHSLLTGFLGFVFLFLPNTLTQELHLSATPMLEYILQLMGGLYLGLAMLSWMSRGQAIGGIYNRPLIMANFIFLLIGTLSMLRASALILSTGVVGLFLAIYYLAFTISFTLLLFRSPV
ncbi:MAG: hypothetical protein AAFY48_21275 [Bacteroidota bacterium]